MADDSSLGVDVTSSFSLFESNDSGRRSFLRVHVITLSSPLSLSKVTITLPSNKASMSFSLSIFSIKTPVMLRKLEYLKY